MIWFTVLHTYQSSNLAQLGEEHGIHLVGDDQISLRKVREFCKTVGASVSIRRSPYKIFIGTNAKVERVLKRHVYADRDLEANCLFAGLPPVYSYFFSLPSGGFLFEPSEVGALRAWLGHLDDAAGQAEGAQQAVAPLAAGERAAVAEATQRAGDALDLLAPAVGGGEALGDGGEGAVFVDEVVEVGAPGGLSRILSARRHGTIGIPEAARAEEWRASRGVRSRAAAPEEDTVMQKTLIIGDIHGCHAELLELLAKAGIGDEDLVVSVGDLVDRGPEPGEVVDWFRARENSVVICGNHERKHVRGVLSYSQQITRLQIGARYEEQVRWMAGLPYHWEREDVRVFDELGKTRRKAAWPGTAAPGG